jgi:hypothetical protein
MFAYIGEWIRAQLVEVMGTEDEQRANVYAAIAEDDAERWGTEDFRRPWNEDPWLRG